MELPLYNNLKEFKEYYLDALSLNLKLSKLSLLRQYEELYENKIDVFYFSSLPPESYFIDTEIKNYFDDGELYELDLRISTGKNPYPENASKELIDQIRKVKVQYEILSTEHSKKRLENEQYLEIKRFIKKEIESEKINLLRFQISETNSFEIPENDYSGKNELSAKEKLIILDKLGIVHLIREKLEYNDNATHLAEILGSLTGIDNRKSTLTGYCNYLIRPDDEDKNSPYNSRKTVSKAMQIYNTFKIRDKTD